MIKILYYPLDPYEWQTEKDVQYPVEYSVVDNEDTLDFKFLCNFYGQSEELSLSFNKNESKGKCYQVNFYRFDTSGELLVTEAFKILNNDDFSKSGSSSNIKGLLKLIFDPEGNIVIFLMQRYREIEGFECKSVDTSTKSTIGYMCEANEWFKERFSLYRKKGEFLRNVDIYKSVSYLEAQIDILTKALISLLPEDSKMLPYLKQADNYSVLNIKPVEDISKEFTQSKSEFRKQQEKYYGALHE